jgi:hypothetical protein
MVGYGMKMSHDSLVIGIEKASESPGVVGKARFWRLRLGTCFIILNASFLNGFVALS